MAKEILKLHPEAVWRYFYELTQIPRPTFHIEEVCDWVYNVGKNLGLETKRDEVGNVLICKPATKGRENKPTITLQSHVDMVPQKNSDVNHDFLKDPIDAFIDGDWVKARGTTLGADNGIGVAMALAVMEDKTLEHGPLEALFTINEEVGMDGANGLKPGFLKGDILMNLDSEEDGNIYIGCAGGVDVNIKMNYTPEAPCKCEKETFKLTLSGLRGGHSGVDINIGRANANKMMARFLKILVGKCRFYLSELEGGNMRNAIPREAHAVISIPLEDVDTFKNIVKEYEDIFKKEFQYTEEALSLRAEKCDAPSFVFPEKFRSDLINALECCQNGAISMLQTFKGTVESSTNLSVVSVKEGNVDIQFLVRSSSDSRKMWVASSIESAFLLMGADVEFDASYTGWQPNPSSKAMEILKQSYTDVYGNPPKVLVMHAGLECGIIQGVMPNMDMISFGPEIKNPHSPDEKVEIKTVETTYNVLIHAIENL